MAVRKPKTTEAETPEPVDQRHADRAAEEQRQADILAAVAKAHADELPHIGEHSS